FPNHTYYATNYWVDVVLSTAPSVPIVVTTTPAAGTRGVSVTAPMIAAMFNEAVKASTISFVLKDSSGNTVPATVTYNPSDDTATLTPAAALAGSMTYTATVSAAANLAGVVMTTPFSWSFTSAWTGITNATIWSSSAAPSNPVQSDGSAVEVGVKF